MTKTIEVRKTKDKELLLEQLRKTPIVQVACQKTNVGRATYYRWRKEDKEFSRMADNALAEGNLLVNDMAESQLISAIKDKNLGAIIFWLKNRHPAYTTKIGGIDGKPIEIEMPGLTAWLKENADKLK